MPEKYEVPKYEITPGYKEEEYKPSTEYKKEEYKPKEEEYKPSTEYKRTAFPLEKTPQALLQYQNNTKRKKERNLFLPKALVPARL